jgi:hypothetical protein
MIFTGGGLELTKKFVFSVAVTEQTCFLCNYVLQQKTLRLPVSNLPSIPLQNQISYVLPRGATLHLTWLPATSLMAASAGSLLIPASRQLSSHYLQPNS